MEEIPNNKMGYINLVNNGINYQPDRRISEPSTVVSDRKHVRLVKIDYSCAYYKGL